MDPWKQSGLGGPTFCRREGLSQSLFYSWKRKLRLREEGQARAREPRRRRLRFVPVEVKRSPASALLELALSGGQVVRVPSGFDAAALGCRAHSLVDEPLSPTRHQLGKES